jgi:hypothetical protein
MTFSDYLIDITLISIVLIQMRGRKLTLHSLLLPVGIVGYVAVTYLKAIPTNGNNLFLIVGCAAVGATLGGLAAHFTAVRVNGEGIPVAKAGLLAAGLWILGTGGRLAFQLYASHGGAKSIEHFSVTHSITSLTAWTSALILMALSEAIVRTSVLGWRGHVVQSQLSRQDPGGDQGQQFDASLAAAPSTASSQASTAATVPTASTASGRSVVNTAGRS